MKKCTQCGKVGDNFYVDKTHNDGLRDECKTCTILKRKEYHHTKKGVVNTIYSNQRKKSKKRGHKSPTYTLNELRNWCFGQKLFHKLYNNWKNSLYDTKLVPSCDRIDDNEGYSLHNIQLMTWEENNSKAYRDKRNGDLSSGNPHKRVGKYTIGGELVETFISAREAGRQTGVLQSGISSVCRGENKTAGGFKWKYL